VGPLITWQTNFCKKLENDGALMADCSVFAAHKNQRLRSGAAIRVKKTPLQNFAFLKWFVVEYFQDVSARI
jgi:hypothetical protein